MEAVAEDMAALPQCRVLFLIGVLYATGSGPVFIAPTDLAMASSGVVRLVFEGGRRETIFVIQNSLVRPKDRRAVTTRCFSRRDAVQRSELLRALKIVGPNRREIEP